MLECNINFSDNCGNSTRFKLGYFSKNSLARIAIHRKPILLASSNENCNNAFFFTCSNFGTENVTFFSNLSTGLNIHLLCHQRTK